MHLSSLVLGAMMVFLGTIGPINVQLQFSCRMRNFQSNQVIKDIALPSLFRETLSPC